MSLYFGGKAAGLTSEGIKLAVVTVTLYVPAGMPSIAKLQSFWIVPG